MSANVSPTPEVQRALNDLTALVRDARRQSRLSNEKLAARASVSPTVVSRLRSGAWVKHGLSEDAMERCLTAMGATQEQLEQARGLFDVVNEWRFSGTSQTAEHQSAHYVRYGLCPAEQPHRLYASIDRISYDELADGHVEGTIERVEPEGRRGTTWACVGHISPVDLHVTFWPAPRAHPDAPQADSSGQVSVHRSPARGRPWAGYFTKLAKGADANPDLHTFKYFIVNAEDPRIVNAASTIAVLDFDNTLAPGWVLRPWLQTLAARDVGRAAEVIGELEAVFERYEGPGNMTHDQLAIEAAAIYANALEGVSVEVIRPLAESFAAEYPTYAFSRELVLGLRDRGMRPVLVTGAPEEVIVPIIRDLDIERAFGLALVEADGRFTGEQLSNAGVAAAKENALRKLITDQECEIVVAVGDSEGDRPLWRAAQVSVRVGGDPDADDVTISGLDPARPLTNDFWSRIPSASWRDLVETADV